MKKYDGIIILGPTGSGKTKLSLSLAKATNGEIINADSMQIYKYFNIGTAKATKKEMSEIPHNLIDFLEPTQAFTVADYKKQATKSIKTLIENNKTPIIVGGTGLYIDSLIKNFSYGNSATNLKVREKYNQVLKEKGKEYLYSLLQQVDNISASKLHANDTKRVIRALEIYECTNTKKSKVVKKDTEHNKSNFNFLMIGLNYDRQELYDKINMRVNKMIDSGLIQEVKNIYDAFADKSLQPMQGIGYKELFEHFDGKTSQEDAIEKIKQHSRNYAKRQLTWFKRNKNIIWFNKSNINDNEILEKVLNIYNNTN